MTHTESADIFKLSGAAFRLVSPIGGLLVYCTRRKSEMFIYTLRGETACTPNVLSAAVAAVGYLDNVIKQT